MERKTDAVEDMLERLKKCADQNDDVSVGNAVEAIGNRGFGPFIFVPALLEETPIGGIPGVPTMIALICSLVAVQLIMQRDHLWLPGFIERRSIRADRLKKGAEKLDKIARWMDRHFGQRLTHFTSPFYVRLAGICIILLTLTVPPLELVPFASSGPMIAIALIGLAITVRDGLVMLIGFIGTAAALGGGLWYLFTSVLAGGGSG